MTVAATATIVPASAPVRTYVFVDISYENAPLILDRRGQLGINLPPNLFRSFQVAEKSVHYSALTRNARIGYSATQYSEVSSSGADIPWAFLFDRLEIINVSEIRTFRIGVHYMIPTEQPLTEMVEKMAGRNSCFVISPDAFGPVEDVAEIYSVSYRGQKMNIQTGPMLRNQWATFKDDYRCIEDELAERAWAVYFFHTKPVQQTMSLKDARKFLPGEFNELDRIVKTTIGQQRPLTIEARR